MSYFTAVRKSLSTPLICSLLVASLMIVGLLHSFRAYGDQLPLRSVTLQQALPGVKDTYAFNFTLPTAATVGSIRLTLCSDSPLYGTPCTAPVGSSFNAATIASQTGATGFSLGTKTNNSIVLTRTPASATAGPVSYTLSNVANPTNAGSYYGRIEIYTGTNGSGSLVDYGGLAFAVNNAVQVTTYVPPYLYFCVGITVTGTDCTTASGNYINFGDFSPAVASVAQTQMVAGSNAADGYVITVSGNTLTSGNNIIPALAANNTSRPGISQFGINLVANQDPQVGKGPAGAGTSGKPTANYGQANSYRFVDGESVVKDPVADYPRNYTTSYIANVAKDQAPGIYVTTLTYVATGSF